MKKRPVEEPLMNTIARKVGRAAGTIAKATQGLAANAAAVVHGDVQTDKAPAAPASASKPRSDPKKKKRAGKRSLRAPRKRS